VLATKLDKTPRNINAIRIVPPERASTPRSPKG
jgi:hypothetical protein